VTGTQPCGQSRWGEATRASRGEAQRACEDVCMSNWIGSKHGRWIWSATRWVRWWAENRQREEWQWLGDLTVWAKLLGVATTSMGSPGRQLRAAHAQGSAKVVVVTTASSRAGSWWWRVEASSSLPLFSRFSKEHDDQVQANMSLSLTNLLKGSTWKSW
jgi:hypothetical protein